MTLQTRLDGSVIQSGSIQITAISNFEGQLTASLPTGVVSSSAQIQLSGITGTTFGSNNFTFPQTVNVTGGVTASAGFFGTASYATTANFALTPSGTSGTSGSSGTSGTRGSSGSSGTAGSAGTAGSSGSAGTAGSSGTSGTRGSSGSTGTSGSSGTSGTSGSAGSSGTLTLSGTTNDGILTLNGSAPNATVESNLTFNGSQLTVVGNEVVSGSTTITGNLTVLGSSSISFISQSTLNIGTNIITTNVQNPSIRFGGLAVIDSGSSPQRSGSLLFDSTNDQWIFVHQNTAGGVTSSVVLMGPPTFNNIGNETLLTQNRVLKAGGLEHISDSIITDNGSQITIAGTVSASSYTSSIVNGVGFFGTASFALTPAGTSGTSGTTGTAGSAGTSGSSGTSGSTGTSGSAGTAGSSGTSGTRGSSGSSGATGANGTSGSSGTSATVTINANTNNYVVTATGTTNTLQGEANLIFDGTNLGIGTSPGTQLHIYNASIAYQTIEAGSTYAFLELKTPSSGTGYIIKNLATGNSLIDKSLYLYNGNGPIQFVPSATIANAVTISTAGYLGIGLGATTNPGVPLQVRGDGSANNYRGVIRIINTDAAQWGGLSFPDGTASDTAANNYYFIGRGASIADRQFSFHIPRAVDYGSGAQPVFRFASTGADTLFTVEAVTGNVYAKGSVGIGTTSPSSKVHLYSTSAPWYATVLAEGSVGRFAVKDIDDVYVGSIDIQNYITFNLSAGTDASYGAITERMRITSGGNVLIGTTTDPTTGGFTNTRTLIKQIADGGTGGGLHIEQNSNTNVAYFGFTGSSFRIGTSYRSTGAYQPIDFYTGPTVASSMILNTSGDLGIGTASPSVKLHVVGTVYVDGNSHLIGAGRRIYGNADATNYYIGDTGGTGVLDINWYGATRIMDSTGEVLRVGGGKVGIGTTAPGQKLQVNGTILANTGTGASAFRDVMVGGIAGWSNGESHGIEAVYNTAASPTTFARFDMHFNGGTSVGSFRWGSLFWNSAPRSSVVMDLVATGASSAALTVSGDVIAYGSPSDIRYKHDIKQIDNALNIVQQLRGVTFKWNQDTPTYQMTKVEHDIGFIAQEVQVVLPELVRADGEGKLSLRDKALIPLLVEAIKEQQTQIMSQQHIITDLQSRLTKLESE